MLLRGKGGQLSEDAMQKVIIIAIVLSAIRRGSVKGYPGRQFCV